ncbi:MAG: metallophosphoesterase [Candidatus Sericytochromatia bacterium]
MKIQYMSDLHLEYIENREYFKKNPVEKFGDVLVLAGDIVSETERDNAKDFFKDIESKFKLIISTMGNHEFYGSEINYAFPSYEKNLSDNHFLLNNQSLIFDNVKFIVSTLWSKVDPVHESEIARRLNDYKYIKKFDNKHIRNLKVEDTNYYHEISKQFIIDELKKDFNGKIAIITHHLPSINCVIPKWRNVNVVSAFANNMDDIILNNKIDCWIFGHQHEFIDDFIGKTKILSNPLGYSKEDNFFLFKSNKCIEI